MDVNKRGLPKRQHSPTNEPQKKRKYDTVLVSDFSGEEVLKLLDEFLPTGENSEESEFEEDDIPLVDVVAQSSGVIGQTGTEISFSPASPPSTSSQPGTPLPSVSRVTPQPSPPPAPREICWSPNPPSSRPNFQFTGRSQLGKLPNGDAPQDFFDLLFTDEFFQLLVRETNSFAEELFLRQGSKERARITEWKDTSVNELKLFLGLYFHMGVIQLNRLADYWNTNEKFNLKFFSSRMSRDRFMMLMQAFHLAPNPVDGRSIDPIYKLRSLLDLFHGTMEEIICPSKNICIDESLAPFRGRISFRQYIPNKRHKYGIKLYMLTEPDGLIHRFLIYAGSADKDVSGVGHVDKVVYKLMSGLLGEGRSIFMDNWYNSVDLAAGLLDQNTRVTGTLRTNRKNTPSDVTEKKLKKGESIQRWSKEGINVTKWKDKREVLTISTEFSGDMVKVPTRRGEKEKPEVVMQYNKHMGRVDRVDQLLSYHIASRKTLRWYKKIAFHIIELMMLNAFRLYQRYSARIGRPDVHNFRLAIVDYLCGQNASPGPSKLPKSSRFINKNHLPKNHERDEGKQGKKQKQQRCLQCHKSKITKYVRSYCPGCPNTPGLCIGDCFTQWHEDTGFELV